MYKYSPIGERVRYFRNQYGISQSKLELEIGASFGSLSRIENGQTNPTKETITKIAKALELDSAETSYLLGISVSLPTQEEIEEAKSHVRKYFQDENRIAYLLDDLLFVHAYSKGICKLLHTTGRELSKEVIGKHATEILLNPGPVVKEVFYKRRYKEILYYQLGYFKYICRFRTNESWYKEIVRKIRKDSVAEKLWNTPMPVEYLFQSKRRYVWVEANGKPKKMYYMRTPIINCPRFEIIEYYA